MTIRKVTPKA